MSAHSSKKRTAIDLFSGCGGLTLGLKDAGFAVVSSVDVDSLAVETYKANHGDVRCIESDIRKVDASALRKELKLKKGDLDLLAGCPPCQGFSSMRTHNGNKRISDVRNDLVFDFLRFVREFEPKAVMMENVPALSKDIRMKKMRAALEDLGYETRCEVLNTVDYGVPQRRRRMILLAGKRGPMSYAKPVPRTHTVRKAIGKLPRPGKSNDPLHDFGEKRSPQIMEMIRMIPKDGGGRRQMGLKWQLDCHKRNPDGFKDVYGRMWWDQPSPTITGGCTSPSKGRFLHPQQNRAITLREAALLQGFPRRYHFSLRGGKQGASLMIGNALPPSFIAHHAKEIYTYLDRPKA